ncbi:MAG: phospholipase D-like domain-containing protein [Acidobacteriota bacterium]
MLAVVGEVWQWLALGLSAAVVLGAVAHAAMWKRESRAALAWIAFILLLPLVGAASYWLFGVNRIQRRAWKLYRDHEPVEGPVGEACEVASLGSRTLCELAGFIDRVVDGPVQGGNRIRTYEDGAAFRAMLDAIAAAERSVTLLTYIFDHDAVGLRFRDALADAVRRGVDVKVLIDAVGDRYTRPPMHETLLASGVRTAVFNPTFLPRSAMYSNLRNHRKLMVVDGRVAFTGGMNISAVHAVDEDPPAPARDVHFRVEGPVVGSLQRAFADDWRFTTDEVLGGAAFFPVTRPAGALAARVIDDGPAETMLHLRWTLLAGLACARRRVRIQTPYFLPDPGLITALIMAARRGVEVEILLPERGNLKLVQWASTALLWQVLEGDCRIFLAPPPFDHSKLMVVDGEWSLIGSANWDPRSLRLNFELNLEVYSAPFAAELDAILDAKLAAAEEITLADVDSRPHWMRLRDGLARLASPYL